jgi:alpha-glucosidase (family GH31 glycosyl hydrolase)
MATETGVGVVRPLFWLFPDDPKLANEGSSWMFGDALLVSPVVTPGETEHSVYLPAGIWYDYFDGKKFEGGKTINYAIDSETWEDIPLFVRAGSIVASQPPQDYTGQQPVPEITLDVFATAQVARFVYYDDDGATYAYEQGEYYRQSVQASVSGQTIRLSLGKPSGSFHSPLRSYLIHMHGARPVTSVLLNGKQLSRVPASRLDTAVGGTFWASGEDKFGPVTTIRIPAQQASSIELR